MEEKIKEAINYTEGSSKLEGLNLTGEEKNIVILGIKNCEEDKEFVTLVKKITKKPKGIKDDKTWQD